MRNKWPLNLNDFLSARCMLQIAHRRPLPNLQVIRRSRQPEREAPRNLKSGEDPQIQIKSPQSVSRQKTLKLKWKGLRSCLPSILALNTAKQINKHLNQSQQLRNREHQAKIKESIIPLTLELLKISRYHTRRILSNLERTKVTTKKKGSIIWTIHPLRMKNSAQMKNWSKLWISYKIRIPNLRCQLTQKTRKY